MIILLTENSPIGMMTLASMKSVMLDCYPVGSYEDPLYEVQEYINLCQKRTQKQHVTNRSSQSLPAHLSSTDLPSISSHLPGNTADRFPDWHRQRWVSLCNNTPWSDMVLSNPSLSPTIMKPRHGRQRETYRIKQSIYDICGWAPDAIINIYNGTPDPKWRARLCALTDDNPEITVISLNALDPKFATNLEDTVHNLLDHHLALIAEQESISDDSSDTRNGDSTSMLSVDVPFEMDDYMSGGGSGGSGKK